MTALLAPRIPMLLLKLAALALVAALALQPILVGQHFGGQPYALQLHSAVGEGAAWLALGQGLLAGLCWYRGALRPSAALVFLLIFVLVGLQLHVGYVRTLSLHIPLGTGLLAGSLVTTLWLWRWPALCAQPAQE
ncbi:MAG: hypothetical protein GEU91_23980 [Rhizobiales bacterium]|nr:hypothetical protein [Hyphomicrobiales bacterium]